MSLSRQAGEGHTAQAQIARGQPDPAGVSINTEERTLTALFLGAPTFPATIFLHGVLGTRLSRALNTRETIVMFEQVAAGLALLALLLFLVSAVRPGTFRAVTQSLAAGLFAGAVASYFLIPFYV